MSKNENIYDIVTDRIIAAMEAGIVPWQKPWRADATTTPTSLASGKPYRGINSLILGLVQMTEGYETALWGTYKQAQALGGNVRKGEKGTPVVLWKPVEKVNDEGEKETFMLMRYFTVFNIAQMDNIEVPAKFTITREPVDVLDGVALALAYDGGPTVRHMRQDRAYYNRADDRITLPMLDQFHSPQAYAETALHEVIHSTGHKSRLDRFADSQSFGCEAYASEELVAEIGAAMLAEQMGIEVEYEQTAAYVDSWLKVLKDDRKMIVHAAQRAQKAVDVVLAQAVAEEVAA